MEISKEQQELLEQSLMEMLLFSSFLMLGGMSRNKDMVGEGTKRFLNFIKENADKLGEVHNYIRNQKEPEEMGDGLKAFVVAKRTGEM